MLPLKEAVTPTGLAKFLAGKLFALFFVYIYKVMNMSLIRNTKYNNIIWLFSLSLLLNITVRAQYKSNVTLPDRNVSKVTDPADVSFRYASDILPATLLQHMQILASDSLEGRETGTTGIEKAAQYIAGNLSSFGYLPLQGRNDHFQPVAFTYFKWRDAYMYVGETRYRLLWDFIAMPEENDYNSLLSTDEVMFLGYGIDDPKYSDYKNADVSGKVIMINKGEPMDVKGRYIITGSDSPSEWSSDLQRKLKIAKAKGVKLVLIIEDDIKKMLEENRRKLLSANLKLGNLRDKPLQSAGHVYISTTIAKSLIGAQENEVLKAREKMAKGKSSPVVLKTSCKVNLERDITLLEGKNIVTIVEGAVKPDEYVVVSAHYDHLGKRGDEVFNGADDNASGTSTLLELAQSCQQALKDGHRPYRSIVFAWFCGEEKGLLGSQYYSEFPVFPLEGTVANINVDMVGRVDDKYKNDAEYIYVIGSDRLSSDLHRISEEVNQKYSQLTLDYTYNSEDDPNKYYYRSDHYNFAKKGVPAIFYFNGTHEDYHRTTDDVAKINFEKMAGVGKLIFHTLWAVSNAPERLKVDGVVR
jgi:hypothetical protein